MNILMKTGLAALSAAALACLPLEANAQDYNRETYSPSTPGMKLKYTNFDKKGQTEGFFVLETLVSEGNLEKGTFAFDQQFFKEDGSPLLKDNHLRMDVTIGEGPTQSYMSGISKVMKTQDRMTKGDISTLPAQLQTGMTVPDSKIDLHIDNIRAEMTTRDRKVVRQESVTTPAGTFDCYLIREEQLLKTVGTQTEKLETWYARGIGAVRQHIYNKKGELVRSMELTALEVK